jgi:selenoprotein W-related protein
LTEEFISNFKGQISEITLIPSQGGVFEVIVDDSLIYSKKELQRFPEEQEVSNLIKEQVL